MSENGILLEVNNLEVIYNRAALAIQGVSFKVPQHSIVAILGVNGAGKTTTLRAVSGFLPSEDAEISDGRVTFEDELLNGKPPHVIARRGIILIPERVKTFVTLTVEENLLASVAASASSKIGMKAVFEYFPVLKERHSQVAGYLSGGERQMLAIASALLCSPKLLMVDELTLGLAPVVINHLMEIIKKLNEELGITIVLVEQNAMAALQVASHGYIMESGRVVYEGSKEALMAQEDVREFYLGLGGEQLASYRDVKQYRRVRRWWA